MAVQDKLVVVFGASGFIGRYAVQELAKAGARVRVAQRDTQGALFLKTLGGLGQTQLVAASVTHPESVARAVAGADVVVNLVGVLSGDFHGAHVVGAETVAKAAAAAGASAMIHVSAIGADVSSASAYARTKGEGEAAVRAAFPTATILRPSVVFGQEDQFINRFAQLIRMAPVVPVIGGAAKFQPVYVGDVAKAIVAAAQAPALHGGKTFELGGPEVLSMAEINAWIGKAIGHDKAQVAVPDCVSATLAKLPGAPITTDQWRLLQQDNVVAAGSPGLAALGVEATPLAAVADEWLVKYRKHGRFGSKAA